MTGGKPSPKVATNVDNMDRRVAIYAKDLSAALDVSVNDVFFAGKFGSWTRQSASELLKFVEEGGNVVLGSADTYTVGGDREPMRV